MSTPKIIKSSYIYYKDRELPVVPEDIIEFVKGFVYTIKNKINKKIYVGQTMSHMYHESDNTWRKSGIKDRWRRHVDDSKSKKKPSQFYNDILEFGEENFEVEIHAVVPINEIHTLNVVEFNAIQELDSLEPKGYNKDKWKNSVCFTKHIFLKYFKLEDKIPSLNSNTTSRDRAQQKCVIQNNILTEFIDKEIEEVDVRLINGKGKPREVRIVVKLKDEKDKKRTNWIITKDPINILIMVVDIARELKEDVFIDPRIITIINEQDINATTYKYQKRLDEVLKYEYTRISGLQTYYNTKGFFSYLLIFSRDKDADIRYSFGGKTVDLNDAYKDAKEFVDKILKVKKINSVIIREPKSCPQQQATTKVAKITFVD